MTDDNTFQTRAGIYVFCADFHSGQWSREYRILSRMKFHLSDSAWRAIRCPQCDPNMEWTRAREVYKALKGRYLE